MELLRWAQKWARYFDPQAIFYLIIAMVAIGKLIYSQMRGKRILTKGITVKGEVVGFRYGLGHFALIKVPGIRFVTQEGKTIETSYTTNGVFTHYEKGMEVTIIYDQDEPTDFFIAEEKERKLAPYILLVVFCGFVILAIRQFLSN